MSLIKRAHDLVGVSLENFAVKLMTEVCIVDEEGNKKGSIGFLVSEDLAKGFIDCQMDPKRYRTRECSVLTDGDMAFLLNVDPVILANVENVSRAIKDDGLKKLSPIQQKLLLGE